MLTFFSLGRVVGHPTDGDVLGVVNVGGWWLLVEVPFVAPSCDVEPDPSKVDGGIGRDKPAGYLIDTGVGFGRAGSRHLGTTQVARTAECSVSTLESVTQVPVYCIAFHAGERKRRGLSSADHSRFEQPTCFSQPQFPWAALALRPDKGVDEVIASRTADFRSESPNGV